ncbi:Tyrosine-protein kinase YwqD [Phaeobacter sp. CECT 5382]|nr:Tyrosine-protein kinase YwqD [Phaeobacter sp. CECT 5382]
MKHFSVPARSGADQGRSFLWDDDDGMTQEGFKRFHRRNRGRQGTAVQDDAGQDRLLLATKQVKNPSQKTARKQIQKPAEKITSPELADQELTGQQGRAVEDMPKPKPMLLKPSLKASAGKPSVGKPSVQPSVAQASVKGSLGKSTPKDTPINTVSMNKTAKPVDSTTAETVPEHSVSEAPKTHPKRDRSAGLPTRFDPWLQLPQVPFDFLGQKPSRLPLVSAFRSSPTARAFDLLRTRLLHSLRDHGWKRVAITSPAAGGGTTFCAVNLALSLARVPGSRTVLMDMNFRRPGVAAALGIPAAGSMVDFLAGELSLPEQLCRLSDTLAVGTNRVSKQNASDILHAPSTGEVLDDMIEDCRADTVLFDLPPVLENDDVPAFLPQVDGVLLISDGDHTTAAQLAACEKMLAGHAPLLGVVLNRAQQTDRTQVTP